MRLGVGQGVARSRGRGLALDLSASPIITAVEAADGQALEVWVKRAINNFVVGAKDTSTLEIWSYLSAGAFRFLAGPRTLSGVLACGVGVSPTNVGLVDADYDRLLGVKGGVSTKYLNTNYPSNSTVAGNKSFGVYITQQQALSSGVPIGFFQSSPVVRRTEISQVSGATRVALDEDVNAVDSFAVLADRLCGITTTSATQDYTFRNNGINYTGTGGATTFTESKYVLARRRETGLDAPTDARIAFYWDGPALPVAGLARLEVLIENYLVDIAPPLTAEAPIGPTFIFLGESNSGGFASNTDLAADELDANPNLRILNNSSLLLEPLDIGTNNLLEHSGLANNATHGWEAGIQQHLLAETGLSQCYLLKCGQGGSKVVDWDQDTDPFWVTLAQRVDRFKLLVENPDFRVWFSFGINDAIAGTDPATWRTATEAWIARVRVLVGVPGLKFYATKLMANTAAKNAINLQLDAIAAADPNFMLLDTTSTTTYPLRDTNHWNAAAMKLMAQQFLALEW